MKRLITYFLHLVIIFSCGDNSDKVIREDQNNDVSIVEDVFEKSSIFSESDIYTAEAVVEGPDEELWIFEPGEWHGEILNPMPDTFETLHVVPFEDKGEDILIEMSYINRSNFHLYNNFKSYTGNVVVFYDREKTTIASEFYVKDGVPEGIAVIYYPDGDIFIKNRYKDGEWVEPIVYPYSCNWSFSQVESKLLINDLVYADSEETKLKISSSMQKDNYLSTILEKESFNNSFQINDEVFTGTIEAYWAPSGVDYENKYFSLQFTNGRLNGNVKIYNDWGELELHERFVMGDLDTTIYLMDYSEMDGMAKPIIYLYPEEEMIVNVELDVKGQITHTYPAYNNGWNVLAKPDGTLIDETGKEYYALYWEGNNNRQFTVDQGFVIAGDQTVEFLEKSLDLLGLNRREANEFIVFWLPILEGNPYNLIHFSTEEYQDIANLQVNPKPQTLIRVMMVYKPLQSSISIPLQDITKLKVERKGFTVVEWGGSLLKETFTGL